MATETRRDEASSSNDSVVRRACKVDITGPGS
jgi:hypothetical protein